MAYMRVQSALPGLIVAITTVYIGARKFPAERQSKLWIKLLGAEFGAISSGRIWTFLAITIIVTFLWAFLMWVPSHP